ncbi:hypothetical protein TH19_20355 [Thalassospira profundimaris]|uniref:Uncharacterized protein n=1 Tax=Thalassospira profundimaris TaxID=502049 RepID=A0A367VZE8_9PROT|nr:hypothetical protein TH19_20355 [Thalassospira profundimaris]
MNKFSSRFWPIEDRHPVEGYLKHIALNLIHFAGGIVLSGKERFAERSGATVKNLDAAGQNDVPARRV